MEKLPKEGENDGRKTSKRPYRVMVRFSKIEYERLRELHNLSQKSTMAAYIRDCTLNTEERYFRAVKAFREFIAEVMRI